MRMRWFVVIFLLSTTASAAAADDVSAQRQAELLHLLRHDCGSCHGMRLTGGLGPALTPGALSGKSAEFLQHVILEGRSGTPMPPWRGMLTRDEVSWLVERLRNGLDD